MNTSYTVLSLLTVLTIMAAGCRHDDESYVPSPTPVRVQTVGLAAVRNGLRYSATINPAEQVELQFKVGGYVHELAQVRGVDGRLRAIQQGDRVTKGMVLARVRDTDYVERVKHAKAQLTRTEVSLQKAQLDWDRASHLFATQSLTKPDYDSAKAQLDSAKASVVGAHAQLAEAQLSLHDSALTAPMDGVLLQRKIEVGDLAAPGTVAFVLGNLSSVKAIFGVPDTVLTDLKVGTPLSITTESLRGREFSGRVTAMSPAADARSRVFNVEVRVLNSSAELKAGMIASLEVPHRSSVPSQPAVPLAAIVRAQNDANSYAVFVIDNKEGTTIARLQRVQLGDIHENTIAVMTGLTAGEQIITTGATLISAGEAVRIIP